MTCCSSVCVYQLDLEISLLFGRWLHWMNFCVRHKHELNIKKGGSQFIYNNNISFLCQTLWQDTQPTHQMRETCRVIFPKGECLPESRCRPSLKLNNDPHMCLKLRQNAIKRRGGRKGNWHQNPIHKWKRFTVWHTNCRNKSYRRGTASLWRRKYRNKWNRLLYKEIWLVWAHTHNHVWLP